VYVVLNHCPCLQSISCFCSLNLLCGGIISTSTNNIGRGPWYVKKSFWYVRKTVHPSVKKPRSQATDAPPPELNPPPSRQIFSRKREEAGELVGKVGQRPGRSASGTTMSELRRHHIERPASLSSSIAARWSGPMTKSSTWRTTSLFWPW
jgi:hypothetical protein